MKTLSQYTEQIRLAVNDQDFPNNSVRMDIVDVGSIHVAGTVVSNEAGRSDCDLVTDHATFDDMFHGRIDPTIAFGQGKLKIDGDMALAMKIPEIFARAAATG